MNPFECVGGSGKKRKKPVKKATYNKPKKAKPKTRKT